MLAKLGKKQLQKSFSLWKALKPRRHVDLTSFVLISKQA
jgi:hypothetical protein